MKPRPPTAPVTAGQRAWVWGYTRRGIRVFRVTAATDCDRLDSRCYWEAHHPDAPDVPVTFHGWPFTTRKAAQAELDRFHGEGG